MSGAGGRRQVWAVLPAVVTAAVLVGACSGGGSGDGSGGGGPEATEGDELAGVDLTSPGASAEQPAAVEAGSADVDAIVADLLGRYDDVVERIVADPEVARHRDDPLTREFLALFEPGNEFAEGSLDGWAANADKGVTLERIDPGVAVNVTVFEPPARFVSADEVTFGQCAVQSYARLDDGEEVTRVEQQALPGEGTAVRVDGVWLLGSLATPEGMLGCGTGIGSG